MVDKKKTYPLPEIDRIADKNAWKTLFDTDGKPARALPKVTDLKTEEEKGVAKDEENALRRKSL